MRFAWIVVIGVLASCVPKHVFRNGDAFTVETLAALKRQEEAATALYEAGMDARTRGDVAACERYMGPALLIEASAEAQAHRALWLAGLPYPLADGTLPDRGTPQDDPGPSAPVSPGAAARFCGGSHE